VPVVGGTVELKDRVVSTFKALSIVTGKLSVVCAFMFKVKSVWPRVDTGLLAPIVVSSNVVSVLPLIVVSNWLVFKVETGGGEVDGMFVIKENVEPTDGDWVVSVKEALSVEAVVCSLPFEAVLVRSDDGVSE